MSVFIDSGVIMYAAGVPHPLREPCRTLLDRLAEGSVDAVTSAEVIQEIFQRFNRMDQETGAAMAEAALDLFDPVLALTDDVMRRVPELAFDHPGVSARDLVHVATCQAYGIDTIVSPDEGFDAIPGITRVAPEDAARLVS
ncbi:MAG: type II toxin-antitoxin system VapC family toxin [Acidimicrobiia bacterium]|nr:type II toxin-antitoxin system VapC family toxin [Acidimicrobiia bacterium]